MKKGFTLMEMLAVVLVIAVVVSMAAPVFRSVRYEMKNSQAKNAAKKLAEAMHSYYQTSRGAKLTGCFTPTKDAGKAVLAAAPSTCVSPGATGIPSTAPSQQAVSQLFACGFLSPKDFRNLPYNFCVNYSSSVPTGWSAPSDRSGDIYVLAGGVKADGSGEKYQQSKGFIFVDSRMEPMDTYK